jgi:glycerophosphoryl diester phosphodiesterase
MTGARVFSLQPLLLGHRGARAVKSIPENTIASFDRCLAEGCNGFEFDVRLTADGDAVICHDAKAGKISIAQATGREVANLPRLSNVLARYHHAFLDIELKVPGLEKIVVKELKQYRALQFVVSSFLPEVLEAMYKTDPAIPLGLICEKRTQLRRWNQLPALYVIPHWTLIDRNLIYDLHAADKRVFVWTVNLAADMRRFAAWEVDGIISDRPKRLVESLTADPKPKY